MDEILKKRRNFFNNGEDKLSGKVVRLLPISDLKI